jgi:hypothetical protein
VACMGALRTQSKSLRSEKTCDGTLAGGVKTATLLTDLLKRSEWLLIGALVVLAVSVPIGGCDAPEADLSKTGSTQVVAESEPAGSGSTTPSVSQPTSTTLSAGQSLHQRVMNSPAAKTSNAVDAWKTSLPGFDYAAWKKHPKANMMKNYRVSGRITYVFHDPNGNTDVILSAGGKVIVTLLGNVEVAEGHTLTAWGPYTGVAVGDGVPNMPCIEGDEWSVSAS